MGFSFSVVPIGAIPLKVSLLHGFSSVLAQSITPAADGTGTLVIQDGNQYNISGGNSNLFLMLPAGIIFSPNASLNVPASQGSLWYISDEGTLALMTEFYDRVKVEMGARSEF